MKLIAGPCIMEDYETSELIAKELVRLSEKYEFDLVFKASYKKANRTSYDSFTGINEIEALEYIQRIGEKFNILTVTDVHEVKDVKIVSEYVDFIQIPAFLCRQTDLLVAAGEYTKMGVFIKKGQFMSPETMEFAVNKVAHGYGNRMTYKERLIYPIERGTTFGYNDLVVDMRSIPIMNRFGSGAIIDCTHSNQIPNLESGITGGNPEMIETIALSGTAAGAVGLFIEVHPNPSDSGSDSATILQLDKLEGILKRVSRVNKAIHE